MKFLRNIVILPGCGQFLPEASFLVREASGEPRGGQRERDESERLMPLIEVERRGGTEAAVDHRPP